MTKAVERYLSKRGCLTAREVPLRRTRFDIVAYDRKNRLFRVVECKLTRRDTSIGRTFGQLAAYLGTVSNHGFEFIDAVSRKLPNMGFRDWMEATRRGRYFQVAFYVALTHEALLNLDLIQALKSSMRNFGIVRVKPGGGCRSYIYKGGKVYRDVTAAHPMWIRMARTANSRRASKE